MVIKIKYLSIAQRKANVRKLPTSELITYEEAYRKNQIYKFARDEARKEIKRRNAIIPFHRERKLVSNEKVSDIKALIRKEIYG